MKVSLSDINDRTVALSRAVDRIAALSRSYDPMTPGNKLNPHFEIELRRTVALIKADVLAMESMLG